MTAFEDGKSYSMEDYDLREYSFLLRSKNIAANRSRTNQDLNDFVDWYAWLLQLYNYWRPVIDAKKKKSTLSTETYDKLFSKTWKYLTDTIDEMNKGSLDSKAKAFAALEKLDREIHRTKQAIGLGLKGEQASDI